MSSLFLKNTILLEQGVLGDVNIIKLVSIIFGYFYNHVTLYLIRFRV